jgi:glucose-6-phosphate 1-dehydrogenase
MLIDTGERTIELKENTIIVVLGASGDLAKKKTFPALFGLVCQHLSEESACTDKHSSATSSSPKTSESWDMPELRWTALNT